jgi:hypothetical protein
MIDKVANIFISLVIVGAITSLVLPGRQTTQVINATWGGFNDSLRTATGR